MSLFLEPEYDAQHGCYKVWDNFTKEYVITDKDGQPLQSQPDWCNPVVPGRIPMEQEYSGSTDFSTRIGELTEEVVTWVDNTFPDRTDASMGLKLYSEIGEMIESDGDPMEVADVFIMLFDYAHRKKVDITGAVRKKLLINQGRQWVTDANGVNRHVK